jgi:hypothetical protein
MWGFLVASRCIFILIMTLSDQRNAETTKKLDFKNSHLTSVGARIWALAQSLPAPAFNSQGTWSWCSGRCSRRRSLCVAVTWSWCPGRCLRRHACTWSWCTSSDGGHMWPDSVEYPLNFTPGIFKPISGLCRSHWVLVGEPSRNAPRLHGA